jgi:hypothetical protein
LLDYARELLREERRSTGGGMLADFVVPLRRLKSLTVIV